MPSPPPSGLPTTIPVAETRTVMTTPIALSNQASTALQKQHLLIKTLALRVLKQSLMPATPFRRKRINHRASFAQRKRRPWSIDAD